MRGFYLSIMSRKDFRATPLNQSSDVFILNKISGLRPLINLLMY